MGQIGSLVSFAPNTIIRSADHNSNNNTIKTTYNTHDAATSGMHGITGSFVGTSDSQTLTNKTLTAPTINDLTLAGTVAFTSTNTTTNPFSLTANSLTTATGLAITANALTSGSGLTVTSTSTSTTVRHLAYFYNNAATAASTSSVLRLESAAASGRLLHLVQTNASSSNNIIRAEIASGATSPFLSFVQNSVERWSVKATGSLELTSTDTTAFDAVAIVGSQTTANGLSVSCDSITTGSILRVVGNGSDTSSRFLLNVINDNALATGAVVARFRQDSTGDIMQLRGSSGSDVFTVSASGTTAITGLATITSSTTTSNVCTITADSLTTGSALRVYSNSSSNSTRELVQIINDNSSADNTVALYVQNDGNDEALYVVSSSTTRAAYMATSGSGTVLEIDATVSSASDIIGVYIAASNSSTGKAIAINFEGIDTDFYFNFANGIAGGALGAYQGYIATCLSGATGTTYKIPVYA